ncbi:MAG: hypothetical protein ABSA77_06295 [Thermoguttaceae bacterium]
MLTPVKQTESTPLIQGTAGPLDSTADAPRINETQFSLIAVEPAARNGDQPIAQGNEPINPLRQPEQPEPVRILDSSTKPGDRPDASLLPNTETPPNVQLRPKNKLTDVAGHYRSHRRIHRALRLCGH